MSALAPGIIVTAIFAEVAFMFVMDWIDEHMGYDVTTLIESAEQVEAERFNVAQHDIDSMHSIAVESIVAKFMNQSR